MSAVAALLWPFRADLAALLSHEAGTQAQIINYLTYNLLSTPFSIASTVMGGVMVGAGATRYNLMVYGGTFWLVRLPLGWLLGHWLWGTASGVFLAMLVSQCLQLCIRDSPDAARAFSTVPLFWNKAGGLSCQCGRACHPLRHGPGRHEIALAAGLPS